MSKVLDQALSFKRASAAKNVAIARDDCPMARSEA
jgi:hypothetical protein